MRAAGKLARIYTEQRSLSPQEGVEGKGVPAIAVGRTPASALVGTTILQMVPALRADPSGHAAVDIAPSAYVAGAVIARYKIAPERSR
jgi:hypothetical protein